MASSLQDARDIQQLIKLKRYGEAQQKLEPLYLATPDQPNILRLYVDVLLRQGDTAKAGPLLKVLHAKAPDHPQVLALTAEFHRLEGRLTDAIDFYLRALILHEDGYLRGRAIDCLIGLDRFSQARQLIDEGLSLHPQDPYLLRRQVRLLEVLHRPNEAAQLLSSLADAGHKPEDYAHAIRLRLNPLSPETQLAELQKLMLLAHHRVNPYLHILMAEIALNQEQKELARSHLETVFTAASPDMYLRKSLGFLFNRLGEYARVIDTLGPVFVHQPRDLVCQQVLLAAGRKSGRLERVKSLFSRAYEQHPSFHKLNGLIKKVERELQKSMHSS